MQSIKTQSKPYALDPRSVFEALAAMLRHSDKYALDALSNETLELRFHRGLSAMQWGQEYLASVSGSGSETTLSITCGGRDGRPKALLDGFKNSKAAAKVMSELDESLADDSRSPFEAMDSFSTGPDGTVGPWTPSPIVER